MAKKNEKMVNEKGVCETKKSHSVAVCVSVAAIVSIVVGIITWNVMDSRKEAAAILKQTQQNNCKSIASSLGADREMSDYVVDYVSDAPGCLIVFKGSEMNTRWGGLEKQFFPALDGDENLDQLVRIVWRVENAPIKKQIADNDIAREKAQKKLEEQELKNMLKSAKKNSH